MIAHLVRSADFERVLRTRSRVSSLHFAVHHVADRPGTPAKPASTIASVELSTGVVRIETSPVDDLSRPAPDSVWLGTVVPKRHARRSVTRSLLKRQIRAAVTGHEAALAGGLWVVRLRAPFDRTRFVSAASDELKRVAREELEGLIGSAARRVAAGA
ncbi:MAG: ribonuclease P protein component [Pseudomonadota bacterium]